MRVAVRAVDRAQWVFVVIAAISILEITILTVTSAIARYVFRLAPSWSLELPSITLIFVVALSLAFTQKMRGHVAVELVQTLLPPRHRARMSVILYAIYFGVIVTITIAAFRFAWSSFVEGRFTEAAGIPLIIPYLGFFIGLLMLCFQVVVDMTAAIDIVSRGGKTANVEGCE